MSPFDDVGTLKVAQEARSQVVPNNLAGYVRVSIRERYIAPAEKEKARIKGRDKFNASATLSLKEHCLLGWETAKPSSMPPKRYRALCLYSWWIFFLPEDARILYRLASYTACARKPQFTTSSDVHLLTVANFACRHRTFCRSIDLRTASKMEQPGRWPLPVRPPAGVVHSGSNTRFK
jgi:hypothetical protein